MIAPKKNRGFVIAIDALLALLVVFTILTLSFDARQHDGSESAIRQQLNVLAERTGVVLEGSGMVSKAVIANSTNDIRVFLNGFPSSLCASVIAYPSPDTNVPAFVVTKSGCTAITGEQETHRQGIIVNSPPDANLYVALISVWVNRS